MSTEAVIETPGGFQIGRVVSRLFGVAWRNGPLFLALTVVFMVPALAAMLLAPAHIVSAGIGEVVTLIVRVLSIYLLTAALVRAMIVDLNGETPKFGVCFTAAAAPFWQIMGIGIVSGVAIVAAMLLLIVPGVLLALCWAVPVPVQIVENTGVLGALERSSALTRGYRLKIFWLALMYWVVVLLLVMPQSLMVAGIWAVPGFAPGQISYALVDWVRECLTAIISATGAASIYYELRVAKEGLGAEQLAAAFD